MKYKKLKAFTLVEMLIVVAIISIIAAGAIFTSRGFRDQVVFVSDYQNVEGMISDARSRSLTGESYVDTNNYDGDDSYEDLILPNGYIVHFETVSNITTVSLYADVFDSIINELDVENDIFIKSYTLDDSVLISVDVERQSGGLVSTDPTDFSFIYSTPDANFQLLSEDNASLEISLYQVDFEGNEKRAKYLFMHYLFGIPETLNDAYLKTEDLTPPALTL